MQAPIREGYTFNGWYDNPDFEGTEVTEIVQGTIEDIALYANWAINSYTITFKDHDGIIIQVNGEDIQEIEYGSSAIAPADPTRIGYTFTGWDNEFDNITEDLVITAQYEINQYTYTFYDEDGETIISTKTVDYGSEIVIPDNPTKANTTQYTYEFNGWDKEVPSAITENIEFVATYTEITNKYTVTFKDHDGNIIQVNGEDTQEIEYGSSATAPADPTRIGYTFTGWDNEFNNITEDLIIIAKYEINQYIITLNINYTGGEDLEVIEIIEGEPILSLPELSRKGYEFLGWYLGETQIETGTIFDFGEDITLIAKWEQISFNFLPIYIAGGVVLLASGILTTTLLIRKRRIKALSIGKTDYKL